MKGDFFFRLPWKQKEWIATPSAHKYGLVHAESNCYHHMWLKLVTSKLKLSITSRFIAEMPLLLCKVQNEIARTR